jgi:DNA modification methylase
MLLSYERCVLKMKKYYNVPEFMEVALSEDVLYDSDKDSTVADPFGGDGDNNPDVEDPTFNLDIAD